MDRFDSGRFTLLRYFLLCLQEMEWTGFTLVLLIISLCCCCECRDEDIQFTHSDTNISDYYDTSNLEKQGAEESAFWTNDEDGKEDVKKLFIRIKKALLTEEASER